jgi:hypothetical protein
MPIAHKIVGKKKNISDLDSLPKLNIFILIVCLLTLAIISLYPILNLSLTISLIDQSLHNIKELYLITLIRAYLA